MCAQWTEFVPSQIAALEGSSEGATENIRNISYSENGQCKALLHGTNAVPNHPHVYGAQKQLIIHEEGRARA